MSHGYSRQKLSILILISVSILLFLMPDRIHAKPVKTENGLVQGTVEDSLRIYRGIPCAAHTTGPFKRDDPDSTWQERDRWRNGILK